MPLLRCGLVSCNSTRAHIFYCIWQNNNANPIPFFLLYKIASPQFMPISVCPTFSLVSQTCTLFPSRNREKLRNRKKLFVWLGECCLCFCCVSSLLALFPRFNVQATILQYFSCFFGLLYCSSLANNKIVRTRNEIFIPF